MMYTEEFLKSFIGRTRKNLELEFTSEVKPEYFEVTDLINSLFGLLIIPEQILGNVAKKVNEKNNITKNDKKENYKKIGDRINDKIISKFKDIENNVSNLECICCHLRNSLSHARISFGKGTNGSIKSIKFTDKKEDDKKG